MNNNALLTLLLASLCTAETACAMEGQNRANTPEFLRSLDENCLRDKCKLLPDPTINSSNLLQQLEDEKNDEPLNCTDDAEKPMFDVMKSLLASSQVDENKRSTILPYVFSTQIFPNNAPCQNAENRPKLPSQNHNGAPISQPNNPPQTTQLKLNQTTGDPAIDAGCIKIKKYKRYLTAKAKKMITAAVHQDKKSNRFFISEIEKRRLLDAMNFELQTDKDKVDDYLSRHFGIQGNNTSQSRQIRRQGLVFVDELERKRKRKAKEALRQAQKALISQNYQ